MLKHEIDIWLESPLTLKLLERIREHKEAHKSALSDFVLNNGEFDAPNGIRQLTLIKGQIFTLELMQNLEEFLEIEEVEDEEIYPDRGSRSGEDS